MKKSGLFTLLTAINFTIAVAGIIAAASLVVIGMHADAVWTTILDAIGDVTNAIRGVN